VGLLEGIDATKLAQIALQLLHGASTLGQGAGGIPEGEYKRVTGGDLWGYWME